MPVQYDALLDFARYRSADLIAEAERDHVAHLLSHPQPRRAPALIRQITNRLLILLSRQRLSTPTPEPNAPPA